MDGFRCCRSLFPLFVAAALCTAPVSYTAPDADLNLDGLVDVADL